MTERLPADFAGWADDAPQGALNVDAPAPPRRPDDLGMQPVAVQNPPSPPVRPAEFGPSAKTPSDFAGWVDEEPAWSEVAAAALGKGIKHGLETAQQGAQVIGERGFGGLKANEGPQDEIDAILRKPLAEGWKDKNWWTAQILSGLGGSWPALGAGMLGGAAGGAVAGPIGALGGSAAGFGAGSALQALAPSYLKARQEGLDHDKAVDRALMETGIAGAVGTAMGAAPAFRPFKQAIADSMLMLFGTAPALMSSQRAAENVVEGKPVGEGVPETAAVGIGTGAALLGGHAAMRAVSPKQATAEGAAPGSVDDFLRRADEADARARGAQTRAEIDEFIRQKDARDAAERDKPVGFLPKPDDQVAMRQQPQDSGAPGQQGQDGIVRGVQPEPAATGAAAEPGHLPADQSAAPPVEPARAAEDAALRDAGWIDEDIASMSPKQRKSELEAVGFQPPKDEAPAAAPTTFQTAKGSTYVVHDDGTTTRDKAARPDAGHEGDEGAKPRTAKTVYVTAEDGQRLAPTQGKWRLIDHGDGTVSLATQNADGRWGIADSQRNVPVSTTPEAGKHPLELWSPEKVAGAQGYGKIHLGNAITSLGGAAPAQDAGTRAKPVKVETPEDMAPARERVNQEPSEAQVEAGNYRKGHVVYDGLPVSIENPNGSTRRGTSPDGTPWEVAMPGDYGYIRGTKAKDGDHVDVFIGDKSPNGKAFIIDQHDLKTGKFDEPKVVVGVETAAEAASLYHRSFSDGLGIDRVSGISEVSIGQLRDWLNSGTIKKPFGGGYDASKQVAPRSEGEAGVRNLEGGQDALLQPEHQAGRGLQPARDNDVSSMGAELSGVSGGRGAAPSPEGDSGSRGQREGVRSRERTMGGPSNVEPQSAQSPADRVSGASPSNVDSSRADGDHSKRAENETEAGRRQIDWEAEGRRAYVDARERMPPDGLKGDDLKAWQRGNWGAEREAQQRYLERAQKRSENRMPTSLVQFLRGMGGVHDLGGDLKSQDMHKRFIGLVSSRGMSLDRAREAAAEAGYLGHDKERAMAETTVSDLLDALMDHPRYSVDDEQQVHDMKDKLAAKKHERRIAAKKMEISSFMDEHGLSPDPEAVERAAALMVDERMPMEDAFERAVMQLAHETPETKAALDATVTEDGFDAIPWDEWTGPVGEPVEEAAASPTRGGDQEAGGGRPARNEGGGPRADSGRHSEPARAPRGEEDQAPRDEGKRSEPDQDAEVEPTEAEKPEPKITVEDAVRITKARAKGDALLGQHIGEYTAVGTRESPWGTERGFGETALEAQHDARRRLGMKDWKAIGAEAFKKGENRIPPRGLAGYPYESTLWTRGWDQANIAEPVPGVDMPGRPAADPDDDLQSRIAAAERLQIADVVKRGTTGHVSPFLLADGSIIAPNIEHREFASENDRATTGMIRFNFYKENIEGRPILNIDLVSGQKFTDRQRKAFERMASANLGAQVGIDVTALNGDHIADATGIARDGFISAADSLGIIGDAAKETEPQAGSLIEREKWNDGRWKAIAGDEVYQIVPGFGGSAARINGKVYGTKGKLRVEITGSVAMLGNYNGPKTVLYDHAWTVKDDPRPGEIEAARKAAAEAKDREWREGIERDRETARKNVEAAIAAGDKPMTFEAFKPGLIVRGHHPDQLGDYVAAEMETFRDGPAVFYRELGDEDAPRSANNEFFTIPQPERFDRSGPEPATTATDEPQRSAVEALRDRFLDRNAEQFPTIVQARKFMLENGFKPVEGLPENKQIEEAIEHALVLAAREIVARGNAMDAGAALTFDKLVNLYERQPRLGSRTSTSIAEQAYSTPAPLAYVASRLAGIDPTKTVLEPTAGNGMLLIEAAHKNAAVNELNKTRADALEAQGFRVMMRDAADPDRFADVPKVDVVIANPPFGAVREGGQSKTFRVPGLNTTAVDYAIALNALEAMKPDGRAVLILGGVKAESLAERQKGYMGAGKRKFFHVLLNKYNVSDIFTVSGDLYERQGAGWPVDVVVIDGRGKSDRKPLTAEPPPLLKTWGEVKEKLNGAPDRGVLGGRGEAPRSPSATSAEPASVDAGSGEPAIRGESAAPSPAVGERAPVGAKPDRGQPTDSGRGVLGDGARVAPEPVRERPRVDFKPDTERRGPVEANSAGQVDYRPAASSGKSLGSLLPANLRTATEKSLGRIQEKHGQIDHYVADALGYDLDGKGMFFTDGAGARREPFSAEQIDAIGLALDNIANGDGFIIGDQCVAGETLIYDPATNEHRAIAYLADAGEPITVLSLTRSGFKAMRASAPFFKGVADLFRVTLDDGLSILVTAGHSFLTAKGWASIREGLEPGAQVVTDSCGQDALSLCSVVSSLPPCAREDDRHSIDTIRDLQRRCSPDHRLDGEQLLMEEEGDLVSAPSQVDARGHIQPSSHADALVLSRAHSHRHQLRDHHSRNSFSPSESRAPSQISSREPASCAPTSPTKHQVLGQSRHGKAAPHQEASAVSLDPREATGRKLSSSSVDHTGLRRVVSIAYERTDKFYDMHVPEAYNYVANHIVNHNTGIGKGRVVAAAIRYAHRKGKIPVFVTEKPDLFGDMWRDLHDIGWPEYLGRPIDMFMTNAGTRIPLDEKAVEWVAARNAAKDAGEKAPPMEGQFSKSQTPEVSAKRMAAILEGAETPDVVFTTYDQMNSYRGGETDRRRFLQRIAPRAFLIMDEAHNAGGQGEQLFEEKDKAPPRSVVFREAVQKADSVLYSSATYAKSPKVMDLFSRTDMAKAVENPSDLAELIEKGGIPLQQVVSAMLADAGQYMRRERSFEGVTYEPEIVPVEEASYEAFTDGLGTIFRFDRSFAKERGEIAQKIAQELGAGLGKDSGVGEGAASSTTFSAIMHNAIGQMILSIKAKGAAQRAIESIRAGEKPVIALSATMESFLSDLAESLDLKPGDPINADFGDVLRRYMERTRRVTIKMPDDTKKHVMIPLSDMSPSARADFEDASKFISGISMVDLPLSPIDAIRSEIQKAGYSVREVTGRSLMIDYAGNEPVLAKRPENERGSTGKRITIKAFNDGYIDAVILNRSGSTGVSMHAGERFKDRRKRRMILVQADPNIDTHMQMLGRIHRTGQVELPAYTQLAADIPAEVRPTAVLMGKMASLNANTTASRKSKFTGETVDFMNKYGDIVAAGALDDMPEIAVTLDVDPKNENGEVTPGLIAKVTGRLTLLRPKQQQALIDRITEDYKSLIVRLDAEGLNDLEAKSVDLQARLIESKEIKPATGSSPFTGAVRLDKVSVKAQGRALSPGEVLAEVAGRLGQTVNADGDFPSELRRFATVGAQRQQMMVSRVTEAAQVYAKKQIAALKRADAIAKAQDTANALLARWQHTANSASPGSIIGIDFAGDDMPAIVLDFRFKGKEGSNPIALSQWSLDLALPNQIRTLSIPLSQVYTQAFPQPEKAKGGLTISRETFAPAMVEAQFENARKEGRENRFIFTGNILAAFDQADGRGQILNFTNEDGSVQPGILMNRKFDPADFMAGRAIRFKTGAQALAFLDKFPRGEITSKDQVITVRNARGMYEFDLPAAKATGGRFFTDSRVRQVYDNWEKRGSRMRATVNPPTARAMIDAMMGLEAVFETRENQAAAQAIVDADAKTPQMAQAAPEGWERVEGRAPRSPTEVAQIRSDVARIVAQTLPMGSIRHDVVDTIRDVADDVKQRSGGSAKNSVAGVYQAGIDKLIEVSTRNSADPKNTAYHEAWHAAQDLGLASERELSVLRSPVEVRRLREFAARNKGEASASQMSQVELEANFFGAYAAAMDRGDPPPRLHAASMGIFARLYELMRRIGHYLRGRGFQITEDIAARFQRGEMRDRPFWDRGESRLYGEEATEPAKFAQTEPTSSEERYFGQRPLKERIGHKLSRLPGKTDLVESILDMHTRVNEVATDLANGRRIRPEVDPYKAKRLLPGATAAMQENLRRDYLEPLVHDAKAARLTLQDIAEWLYAQHAPERNAAMDLIDERNEGRGSGISDDQAAQIIDRLTREGKAGALDNIAQRVAAIREYNLDLAERAGLLSEEQANAYRSQYQNYVPLKGWDDPSLEPETAHEARPGGGMRVAGREFRQAFGRKTIPSDPLSNLVNDTYRMIDRAAKNRALNTVWNFMRSLPAEDRDGVVTLDKGKMVKAVDQQTGMVVWREEAAWRFRENVVPLKIGGTPHYLVFEDPIIAKALMRTSADKLHWLVGWMGRIINTAKGMWTHWNPDFVARHFFLRYPIEGASNAGENGIGAVVRSFKGYPGGPAYIAIRRHAKLDEAGRTAAIARLSDPKATTEEKWLGYYEEMRRAGGLMNWADFGGVDRVRAKLDKALLTLDKNPVKASAAYARGVHEAINIITSAMDNAQRLAAYVEAREKGANRIDAAMAAREATVDFALKGTLGNYMTLMWPFANTAAQTASRMTRATRRSKAAMAGVLGSWVAIGLSAGLFAYLFGGNDRDGKPFIEKIGDWTRRLNLVAPFGPTDDKGRPYMLTISLPYNYALPFTIGQTIAALIMKSQGRSKEKASHIFGNLAHSALEAFTPIAQENSLVGKAMPEVYRPFHHVAANKNWYGGPVHPNEEPWNRGLPKSERSFRNTPEGWKVLARGLNNYTGFDAHPEDYREVMSYFTSTMQGVLARSGTAAGDAMRGDKPDPTDVPILHALVSGGKQYDAADRRSYFEARDEKYTAENQAKNLRKSSMTKPEDIDRARQYQVDHAKDIAGAAAFRSADAQRRSIMKQIDRVKEDKSILPYERNRRIQVLQQRELEVMRRARAMTGE